MRKKGFKKAVVIFIDILGTRDRKDFDEWYEITDIFYQMIQREKELDRAHEHVVYKREIHLFSDCAYIVYDFKDGIEEERKNIDALMTIACYNTEKVLWEFLRRGFIARGAMTYGDIYYETEKGIFFGPAMNNAYEMESKKAKYPRVIIDPTYVEQVVNYNNREYRNTAFKKMINGEIIKQDLDGFCFIHYLNSLECGVNRFENEELVEKTLALCESEKNKQRENDNVRKSIIEKYAWLKNYILVSEPVRDEQEMIDITDPKIMEEIGQQEMEFIQSIKKARQ